MKCVYIFNPNSGKKKHVKMQDYIVKKLLDKFEIVDVRPTKKRGDASVFAKEACGVYDVIVVAGGDGTLNEVINGVAENENRPQIGYIPTGTCNDLARSLKIPFNIKKAVDVILKGNSLKHDIFKANDKYGIYVCAFGLFTAASYSAKQDVKNKFGKIAYYFSGIKELGKAKKFPITLKTENLEFTTDIMLGIISNGRYCSGYKIDKDSNCHDGVVNVILFKEKNPKSVSLKTLLTIFRLFLFGVTSIKNVKNCTVLKLSDFKITLADNLPVNVDGEQGLKGTFDFSIAKEHIEIFVKNEKTKQTKKK